MKPKHKEEIEALLGTLLKADETQVATTPVITQLVSMDTPHVFSVMHLMVTSVPDLAHQLIDAGAIPRCMDALACVDEQCGKPADTLLGTLLNADPTQKVKVFLYYEKSVGQNDAMLKFNTNGPAALTAAFKAYYTHAMKELENAFHKGHAQPHYATLVNVAMLCDERGSPEEILARLGHRLEQFGLRVRQQFSKDSSVSEHRDHGFRMERLQKCVLTLTKPTMCPRGVVDQFAKAMPVTESLPALMPPETSAPPLALMPPAAAAAAAAAAPPLALMPPAAAAAAVAPPPAMVASPPAAAAPPPSLYEFLRVHVLPRTECDKCDIARGPDASVRIDFGNDAKNKCASLKRACPLAAHAISLVDDGVPLVEEYETKFNVKAEGKIIKRQKFRHFMQNEYGVGPLGKDPSHKVTLYNPAGVSADLALEGCEVKLKLKFHAWTCTPTSEGGTKDNYMGFKIV